jgi:hypothetical protein
MSCFIVSDKTIHHIAPLFAHDGASCEFIDTIGRSLLRLNYVAHAVRYRTPDEDLTISSLYRYRPMGTVSAIQKLKSLQCWLYQVAESDSLMNSPLYLQGREIERGLMQEVIMALPEYEAADWS